MGAERIVWIDATAGVSGDMLLGALLDAGAPIDAVREAIAALGLDPEISVAIEPVRRAGLRCAKAIVNVRASGTHRPYSRIRSLLDAAPLQPEVRRFAGATFAALADAEARIHGMAVDDVVLHEAGAADSIADVVGCAVAVHCLGLTEAHVVCSPVSVGSGYARTDHGLLPVPVPAVAAILAAARAPSSAGNAVHESCTPTGAALVAILADLWGPQPLMRVISIGTGAGDRDIPDQPNIVRVLIGESGAPRSGGRGLVADSVVIEANVDDLDPRVWPVVLEQLIASGARDAWLTPVLMKKGRPAHVLHVLCDEDQLAGLQTVIFEDTSAIGVRMTSVRREPLHREFRTVQVAGRAVRVKIASRDGRQLNMSAEFEDAAAVAAETGLPVREVLARAVRAARDLADRRT